VAGVGGLRARVQAFVDQWDAAHADWCCTRGCPLPGGRHVTDASVTALLAGNLELLPQGQIPTEPCPGTCTCDVGMYVAPLREALAATEEDHRG
jgi:hypothetical protein